MLQKKNEFHNIQMELNSEFDCYIFSFIHVIHNQFINIITNI